jgi:hypothetical protein
MSARTPLGESPSHRGRPGQCGRALDPARDDFILAFLRQRPSRYRPDLRCTHG